jgi:amidase
MAEATSRAVEELIALLRLRHGLSYAEAGMVISLAGDVRFCQALNPFATVRVALPKSVAPGLFV